MIGRWLVEEKRTGKPSSSKLWRQVACAMATYIVAVNAKAIDPWLLLVYLGTVGGFELAHRVLESKTPRAGKEGAP